MPWLRRTTPPAVAGALWPRAGLYGLAYALPWSAFPVWRAACRTPLAAGAVRRVGRLAMSELVLPVLCCRVCRLSLSPDSAGGAVRGQLPTQTHTYTQTHTMLIDTTLVAGGQRIDHGGDAVTSACRGFLRFNDLARQAQQHASVPRALRPHLCTPRACSVVLARVPQDGGSLHDVGLCAALPLPLLAQACRGVLATASRCVASRIPRLKHNGVHVAAADLLLIPRRAPSTSWRWVRTPSGEPRRPR